MLPEEWNCDMGVGNSAQIYTFINLNIFAINIPSTKTFCSSFVSNHGGDGGGGCNEWLFIHVRYSNFDNGPEKFTQGGFFEKVNKFGEMLDLKSKKILNYFC